MPSRRSPSEARPALTTGRIARAALAIVEESGYPAVSMRAVAQRLDTGQASLYAHVRGKADLDRVMIEEAWADFPWSTQGSWRERLSSDATSIRRLYARYPGLALASFASLPQRYADELEQRLELLVAAGFTVRQAQAADLATALLATVRAIEDAVIVERIAESGMSVEGWWQYVRGFLGTDADVHPLSAETSTYLTPEHREWMSAELVELVLDGIEARYLRNSHQRQQ
ncbi:MAG: TetR family transcriptional regulator [Nocardioides sp.]